jgi:hypothetical protein
MKIILKRSEAIGEALPGEMTVEGMHIAWTLERVAVAIPEGTYQISLYPSPHFGRLMPMLDNVADRSDILIHWGNYPQNSDGCILVGENIDRLTGDILSTQQKFDELFPMIEAAVNAEGCQITIFSSSSSLETPELTPSLNAQDL